MKQTLIARMAPEKLAATTAYGIYSQTALPPNQRFMNLIAHAHFVTANSGTVERDQYKQRRYEVNVYREWAQNPELHACLECARLMLADKNPDNLVQPKEKLADCENFSPLTYAKALKKFQKPADHRGPFHKLGKYFENVLLQYQAALDFAVNAASVQKRSVALGQPKPSFRRPTGNEWYYKQ